MKISCADRAAAIGETSEADAQNKKAALEAPLLNLGLE
jgi:hypothetical protein